MHYLSIVSTIITFIFTGAVFNRYLKRRHTHLLLWAIGLLFYGLGTLSEVILSFTFNPWVLKLWYLMGAILTAAWLGQGTIALLVRKRGVAQALTGLLIILSLAATGLMIAAPLTSGAASYDLTQTASVQYKAVLDRNGAIILLTILLNIYGTFTLVGGAIYSAYIFWRKRVLANRMYGNILIAAGALMPALGGTFTKAGLPDWLYVSELTGAILMFLGFLKATATQPMPAETSPVATD